jgi:hypothetical protein
MRQEGSLQWSTRQPKLATVFDAPACGIPALKHISNTGHLTDISLQVLAVDLLNPTPAAYAPPPDYRHAFR